MKTAKDQDHAAEDVTAPRPTPFTSGTITVGYPLDKREREALDELRREDRDGPPSRR